MWERRNKKQTKKLQNKKERQKERTKRERIHYNKDRVLQTKKEHSENKKWALEIKNDIKTQLKDLKLKLRNFLPEMAKMN